MDRIRPLVLGIYASGCRPRYRPPASSLGRKSVDKKMKASNKAFHHYGAQGAPRVNADVGVEEELKELYEIKGIP